MDQQEYKRHVKDLETKRDEAIKTANEVFNKKLAALNILYGDDEPAITSQQPINKQPIQKNNNKRPGEPDYGVVSNEVNKALESFAIEETFTTQDVFKKLENNGHDFKRPTISGVLKRLSKSAEYGLKLTRRGKGSKPSHYKRINNKTGN